MSLLKVVFVGGVEREEGGGGEEPVHPSPLEIASEKGEERDPTMRRSVSKECLGKVTICKKRMQECTSTCRMALIFKIKY